MINVSDSSIHKEVANFKSYEYMRMMFFVSDTATQATQNSSYPNSTWLSAGYLDFQKCPSSDLIWRGLLATSSPAWPLHSPRNS